MSENMNGKKSPMEVVGYADKLSVQPGDMIRFFVSCESPSYQADVVRLIHGDDNPKGPGFREEPVKTRASGRYKGRKQSFPKGSYAIVPDRPLLRKIRSFAITAWIYPTTPKKGLQGIVTKWSAADSSGFGLFIGEKGELSLLVGDGSHVSELGSGRALRPSTWCFVAASYDAPTGRASLSQLPGRAWPGVDDREIRARRTLPKNAVEPTDSPLLIAAHHDRRLSPQNPIGGHFNGKIDSPRLFKSAVNDREVEAAWADSTKISKKKGIIASWDFSLGMASTRATDTSGHRLDGLLVNTPARAMTGHNWRGRKINFNEAPEEYGAIYFHDDDLDDANWESDLTLVVPASLRSGIYALRLRGTAGEGDYVPFFVRPRSGTAKSRVAFLAPTYSYLAYGNVHIFVAATASKNTLGLPPDFVYPKLPQDKYIVENGLTGFYDSHTDGSGVGYTSRLKPILNMRPKYSETVVGSGQGGPHQLNADLHLLDWMEVKGIAYDVITDEDLHQEGAELLRRYSVVVSGTHPEYWTERMLDSLEEYLNDDGGRFMYLGGNGLYWIISIDPKRPHIVELRRWGGSGSWVAEMGEFYHSTTGEAGGAWRTRGRYPQKIVGVGTTATAEGITSENRPYRRAMGSFDPRASFIFEGIGKDELIGDFDCLTLHHGAAGFEIDRMDQRLGTPAHALLLASATDFNDDYQRAIEEVPLANSKQGGSVDPLVRADMVYFEYPKGGAIFSVGSISWCGCLSYNNYTNNVSRITENVLRRFTSLGTANL